MNRSVASNVRRILERIGEGEIFDYSQFRSAGTEELALAKELSRLATKGVITRIGRGRYAKPRVSKFGPLQPEEGQIIKSLTYQNNILIGYLTGLPLFNKLGLTTQVSNVLVIGRNSLQPSKEIEGYKVRFVKRLIPSSEKDVKLFQLLDSLRDIKKIPDTSISRSLLVLQEQIKSLSQDEKLRLVKIALKFNPSTRALLGALVEKTDPSMDVIALKKSLNAFSKYQINVGTDVLPTKENWSIE